VFHLCTPFQDYVAHWRQLFGDITQSVLANALTCALPIAVQAVGPDRCQQNTGRAQNIPNYPDFFLSHPPSCPSIFRLRGTQILLEVSE
jgi:hypothetical protein